jgi:glycosyltransferase involved in cell wall biosynthesis
MRVLFVSSGRQGKVNPIIQNQGESLLRAGVEVDFFMVSGRGWRSYVKAIKPLRKRIKEGHYDVIHAHYSWTAYLASIASSGLQVPMVVSLMGNDILDYWWYPGLARLVAKLKPWKEVIVKSQEMKLRVGISCAIVVPNGVNMERFVEKPKVECQEQLGWDTKKKHVLFPARKEDSRKNWPLAEGAVKMLPENIEIELHQMNGVPNDKTPIMYNAADVMVLPSFYEGSANALKEAMACNVPLVTTDMGDCRERIEGVEGCYVAKTYEVEEFAELLGRALAFGGKIKGRERLLEDGIADFQIAERLVKIYESVIRIAR